MSWSEAKPWLIDPPSRQVTTYGELWQDIIDSDMRLVPLCQPNTTRKALLEITKAVAYKASVTFFDADFTEDDIRRLGYSPEDLLCTAKPNCGCPVGIRQLIEVVRLREDAGMIGLAHSRINLKKDLI